MRFNLRCRVKLALCMLYVRYHNLLCRLVAFYLTDILIGFLSHHAIVLLLGWRTTSATSDRAFVTKTAYKTNITKNIHFESVTRPSNAANINSRTAFLNRKHPQVDALQHFFTDSILNTRHPQRAALNAVERTRR